MPRREPPSTRQGQRAELRWWSQVPGGGSAWMDYSNSLAPPGGRGKVPSTRAMWSRPLACGLFSHQADLPAGSRRGRIDRERNVLAEGRLQTLDGATLIAP